MDFKFDFDIGDTGRNGKKGIILNPTPSNDPEDPLVSKIDLDRSVEGFPSLT